jgi:hypothetical protein
MALNQKVSDHVFRDCHFGSRMVFGLPFWQSKGFELPFWQSHGVWTAILAV